MIALDANVLIYACDKAAPACQQIALDLTTNTADAINCGRSHVSSSPHHEVWVATDLRRRRADTTFLGVCPLVTPRGSGVLDRAKSLHLTQCVVLGRK